MSEANRARARFQANPEYIRLREAIAQAMHESEPHTIYFELEKQVGAAFDAGDISVYDRNALYGFLRRWWDGFSKGDIKGECRD